MHVIKITGLISVIARTLALYIGKKSTPTFNSDSKRILTN